VVLNAQLPFYEMLQTKLSGIYEDLMFPLDAEVLLQNCLDFPARVQQASSSALAIANFLKTHDSISHVNYPTMVASTPLYEQYRRPNGGYGSLISFVFKNPNIAIQFYDAIDLCKGPSFGTNFTLVLPYSQLAHAFELDWAESQGMAKHIIRISVGLEDESTLKTKFDEALKQVEAFEKHRIMGKRSGTNGVCESQQTLKVAKPSTVEALRSLDGTIEWGRPGPARSDFRSNSSLPASIVDGSRLTVDR
jgi:cystathionine gamma-synthase